MTYNKKIKYISNLQTDKVSYNAYPGNIDSPQFNILIEDILKNGILSPIMCIVKESYFLCKSGNQRLYVAKNYNIKYIPSICVVLEKDLENEEIVNNFNKLTGKILDKLEDGMYYYHKPIIIVEGENYFNAISSSYHLENNEELLNNCPSNPYKMKSKYIDQKNKKTIFYKIENERHIKQ